jgi:hypothetical protein
MAHPLANDLAALLAAQDQAISRTQARFWHLTDAAVSAHLAAGRWQRVHPGVYTAYSGPLTRETRLWAALLYAGPEAVLSHDTAGMLWGLLDWDEAAPVVVTVPANRRVRDQPGVRIHRSRRLVHTRHPAAWPPRTRVADTALDIALALDIDDGVALLARACQRRLTSAHRLAEVLEFRPHQPRQRVIQRALIDIGSGAHSMLELRYLRAVERAHGLPEGRRQRPISSAGRREWIDVYYAAFGVRCELDGRLGHLDPVDSWRDMERDNRGVLAGEPTLRFGWTDVVSRPCAVARQVADLLRLRGWTGASQRCGNSCRL